MTWRSARGLVFVRMRGYPVKDSALGAAKPGVVLNVMRDDDRPPPYLAEAWKVTGGKWSDDFGGRWLVRDRGIVWEWC